jgi:enoyl-CoA hydratase/carnithine racemase
MAPDGATTIDLPELSADGLGVSLAPSIHVATIELQRPPNNHFDGPLLDALATAYEALDSDDRCRAIVLAAQGKHFCAGRDFAAPRGEGDEAADVYAHAARLLSGGTPWIAAVQGGAVGGGFGLAMAADLRVAGGKAWFSANFSRLGFHPGFGLSMLLPEAIGATRAAELLYTGRRVGAEEAYRLGLVDRSVAEGEERAAATALAADIASSAPLAVRAIRATLRGDLVERFRRATAHETAEQMRLRATDDHREGVAAAKERRTPQFRGR